MTADFVGWAPPPGAVVEPPVHPETTVDVFYSDGTLDDMQARAGQINWSAEGDGPRVVAYSVVREYVEPKGLREFWIVAYCEAYDTEQEAIEGAKELNSLVPIIHVREVPEPSREVVAWAVILNGQSMLLTHNAIAATQYAERHGGTVVKLTGYL